MKETSKIKEYVRSIINLHESNDFETLSSLVSEKEIKAATWFTKKRFFEVCEAIKKEIGNITSLEYIETLNRNTSYLTLWKSTYNKTKDEVLWQIIFDTKSNKIKLMHINWEQI
ncbi:MAG: hypothetical protein OEW99_08770 [Gammaproteobacteria bacterium]|nr:hypothetical protein [Gammaproteobacteria bacterium]MDH5660363.1 hypothetical protein [Gammaproteobacteria bacterium]